MTSIGLSLCELPILSFGTHRGLRNRYALLRVVEMPASPPEVLQFVELDSVFDEKCKMLFALLDDAPLVAVFSACLDACSFSSDCGNNIYHFLTRATLIVSHAML